jgi:transposase InsO family protein
MDIHKNARLTVFRREQLVIAVLLRHQSLAGAAADFMVSAKTVGKWVRRFQQEGFPGLRDHSSRPHRSPARTHELLAQFVEVLRRRRWTGMHIALVLHLSRPTVSRLLRRLNISRLRDLEPSPPILRYEHPAAGDLLHLDIKKLARFDTRPTPQGKARRRLGYQYLHVAIDDHSRIAYARILPDETRRSAVRFLSSAIQFFARFGIRFRRILSDNGSCYRSHRFRQFCQDHHFTQCFTRPYTPRTNGKAERFIQTILRQWVRARSYVSSDQRNADLPLWLRHYNFHRPHASLNHAPPVSRSPFFRNNLLIHHKRRTTRHSQVLCYLDFDI